MRPFLSRRLLAILAVAVLALAGAGVAFTQEGPPDETPAGRPADVPPDHANTGGADADDEHEDADDEEADDSDSHDAAGDEQDEAEAQEHEGEPREIKGIPDDNPSWEPVSGGCDRGETDVKTTPSGVRVNVPCHVVER